MYDEKTTKFTVKNKQKFNICFVIFFLYLYAIIRRTIKTDGIAIIAVVFVPTASAIASVEKYNDALFLYFIK